MSETYYLHAGGDEARPAVVLGQGFPSQVNGLPAYYFWRKSAKDGEYTHPIFGWKLKVDPARRKNWERTFREMRKNDVEVPVVEDHREKASATLGYVVDVRQNGRWYEELHQYLGEDARDTALKNKISVGIDPEMLDSSGRVYRDAIRHSSVTPFPVITGTGEAVPIAASRGQQSSANLFTLAASGETAMLNPELLQNIRDLLGAADLTEETAVARLYEFAKAQKDQGTQTLSRATNAETSLAAANQRIQSLSAAQPPKSPDPETLDILVENAEGGVDSLVSLGCVTPDVGKKLCSILVGEAGKPNLMTLSRSASGTDKSLARQVIEALKDNKPVSVGGLSGVQTLSRVVPGEEVQTSEAEDRKAGEERGKRFN